MNLYYVRWNVTFRRAVHATRVISLLYCEEIYAEGDYREKEFTKRQKLRSHVHLLRKIFVKLYTAVWH